TRRNVLPSLQGAWIRAIGISLVGILILALYPANWRESIPGALFTVVVGMVCLFVSVWAWGAALSPSTKTQFEDSIDDLASIYHWLKAHTGPFIVFCNLLEKGNDLPFVSPVLNWLNPRRHTWNLVILLGVWGSRCF